MKNKKTSLKIAKVSSIVLRDKRQDKKSKQTAGSALSQYPGGKKSAKRK
jgi:hypothetical protein